MPNFILANTIIKPGERQRVQLGVARLYDFTEMRLPVEVIRGKKDGPVLFVSAAIHGDEINGVEIIRRLLRHPLIKRLPIVNMFGFNNKSRYLPDRRDLNRCFPGNEHGSMGSQLADIFMREIVSKCTHGIDLHTGAFHRFNLPQIRADLDNPETLRLAKAFGAPVMLDTSIRDGSLREVVAELSIPMLLYEAGEFLRFDEPSIQTGLRGILAVMHAIGMLSDAPDTRHPSVLHARASHWVRAPHSGIFLGRKKAGDLVKKSEVLGILSNPFGDEQTEVYAPQAGVVIGLTQLPLANEGDALYHIATFRKTKSPAEAMDRGDEPHDPVNEGAAT
jgi:predicted deacylase